jgi:hypothetical protein
VDKSWFSVFRYFASAEYFSSAERSRPKLVNAATRYLVCRRLVWISRGTAVFLCRYGRADCHNRCRQTHTAGAGRGSRSPASISKTARPSRRTRLPGLFGAPEGGGHDRCLIAALTSGNIARCSGQRTSGASARRHRQPLRCH